MATASDNTATSSTPTATPVTIAADDDCVILVVDERVAAAPVVRPIRVLPRGADVGAAVSDVARDFIQRAHHADSPTAPPASVHVVSAGAAQWQPPTASTNGGAVYSARLVDSSDRAPLVVGAERIVCSAVVTRHQYATVRGWTLLSTYEQRHDTRLGTVLAASCGWSTPPPVVVVAAAAATPTVVAVAAADVSGASPPPPPPTPSRSSVGVISYVTAYPAPLYSALMDAVAVRRRQMDALAQEIQWSNVAVTGISEAVH